MGLWKVVLLVFQWYSAKSLWCLCFSFHCCSCFSVHSWSCWWRFHGSLAWLIPPRRLPLPPDWVINTWGAGVGVKPVCMLGCVWYRMSHSLIQSQSTIGLCQKGKRCHMHLLCFFTVHANLNIAYYHNLSRIKIAQNKWQMAGNRALCQEMAKGREKWAFELDCRAWKWQEMGQLGVLLAWLPFLLSRGSQMKRRLVKYSEA